MSNNDMSEQAKAILAYLRQDGHLLLEGKYWEALYRLLPTAPDGRHPPPPIILAGAQIATDKQKFDRLIEHIEWADRHGVISQISSYLGELPSTCFYRIRF